MLLVVPAAVIPLQLLLLLLLGVAGKVLVCRSQGTWRVERGGGIVLDDQRGRRRRRRRWGGEVVSVGLVVVVVVQRPATGGEEQLLPSRRRRRRTLRQHDGDAADKGLYVASWKRGESLNMLT